MKDEEGKKPEPFRYVEAWINSGGHLVVLGTWNGVDNHTLERFGITTSDFHTSYFEPVPGVTEKPLAGNEDLVPAAALEEWPDGTDAVQGSHPASGRRTRKTLPWPRSLVTLTEPSRACARCLTMANPRPVPPNSRERALSTR